MGSLGLYLASTGIRQTMYKSLLQYEESIKIKEFMKPLINSNQASASDISNGSNEKSIDDKSEETIRTDDSRS